MHFSDQVLNSLGYAWKHRKNYSYKSKDEKIMFDIGAHLSFVATF